MCAQADHFEPSPLGGTRRITTSPDPSGSPGPGRTSVPLISAPANRPFTPAAETEELIWTATTIETIALSNVTDNFRVRVNSSVPFVYIGRSPPPPLPSR